MSDDTDSVDSVMRESDSIPDLMKDNNNPNCSSPSANVSPATVSPAKTFVTAAGTPVSVSRHGSLLFCCHHCCIDF